MVLKTLCYVNLTIETGFHNDKCFLERKGSIPMAIANAKTQRNKEIEYQDFAS